MEKDSRRKTGLKILGIAGTIFFFASYIPFVILPFASAGGVSESLFEGRTVYGWLAVANTFKWFCIIPVFPVCLIYQIIFGFAYLRRKHTALKISAAALAALLIISTAATCVVFAFREKARTEELLPKVRAYLKENYGEEFAGSAELTLYSYDAGTFKGRSPVLPADKVFEIDDSPDGYYDDIVVCFLGKNKDYEEGFRKYLDARYGLPDGMHCQVHISRIDFTGFKDGADTTMLYDKTSYQIAGVTVEKAAEDITQDKFISLTKEMLNEYIPGMEGVTLKFFMIYVKEKETGNTVGCIQIDFPSAETLNYTVVQIERRIYEGAPETIWDDVFYAEEV